MTVVNYPNCTALLKLLLEAGWAVVSEALPHLQDAESCVISALGVHPGVEHVPVGRAGLTGELEQENEWCLSLILQYIGGCFTLQTRNCKVRISQ